MFTVPTASSSPPSTPDTRSKSNNYFKPSTNFFAASNVSNTPAGSPDHPSTTPAGHPPASSVFGSANYNSSIPYPQGRYGAIRSSPLRQPAHTRHVAYDDGDAMDEDLMEESFLQNDQPIPSVEGLNMPAIAKTVANKTATLTESDDIILGTEHVMQNLHTFVRGNSASGLELDLALGTAVEESLRVWRPQYKTDGGRDRMGPGANASSSTKAFYLTSLLLPLHHPALRSQSQHSTFKTSRALDQPKPIPQILVEWLQAYHTPYPGEVEETLNFQPNPCASDRFWDVVLSSVVRGSILDGLKLLKEADFREAETALQEGAAERGYRGKQLGNVQRVVNRAIAVLEACPAVHSNDWNVSNADWAIFRKRVEQAMQDLASFADGPGYGNDDGAFDSENFGLASVRSDDFGLSRLPRRLPFPVQESLQALYNNLLGNGREITSSSADWLEATICQTLWWNGEEEEIGNVSFTASRNQQSLIRAKEDRPVDIMPRTAYRQKLSLSLRQVFAESEDQELQVNTSSSVEVGLACVLEDDLDGVLTILRGWSMPMSATVVEIAALGQWPGLSASSQEIMEQFSQSDLMVLGLSQNQPKNSHDDVLISYAGLLFEHADLESTTYQAQQEGWELAIQLAGRVSIPSIANDRITSFLDKLDLSSASGVDSEDTSRIERVMALCERLALSPLARRTAERYASDLADHTHNYGGSLYYFARAHNLARVKEVLNLLISSCLVQSIAYPRKPDHTLQTLLTTPKQALAKLSLLDHEAAELLSIHFSGYAMLRNFYDLRDQEVNAAANGTKPALRPIARKKAAAAALIAVVTSAADSIHGGLYDASVDSIIPIDGLLILLGEALVFLSPPTSIAHSTPTKPTLSAPQLLTLLSATESLATLPSASSIHTACADVLRAALAHAHDRDGDAAASSILSKSTSSDFSFDMVNRSGESGKGSQASLGGNNSNKGKGKVKQAGTAASAGDAKEKRAWDWRMGFSAESEPEELMRVLRLGLAKEVARAWVV